MNKLFFSKKYHLKNIILKYILLLIPLICYGIYKNGILLYQKNIISFWEIFRIIYLIFISFWINVFVNIIFKKKIKWSFDILIPIIVPLFMPYNTNYLYYIIGYFISNVLVIIISQYVNVNKISLYICIITLLIIIVQGLNYYNPLEVQNIYSFNTFDLMCGRTYGGIGSTWIIYAYLFVVITSICNNYKYLIPVSSILVYFLLSYLLIGFSYKTYTNSFVVVSLILFNIDTRYSPITIFFEILCGILQGILITLVVVYFSNPIWIFACQLFVSIAYQIIAKLSKKCYNMNDFLKNAT